MYHTEINLTRTTWSSYRQMYQAVITDEVDEAYEFALKLYSNPEIYTLEKSITKSVFLSVAEKHSLNDYKKRLIESACFNLIETSKMFKPAKYFFENAKFKNDYTGFGLDIKLTPLTYTINIESAMNPIDNPLHKIFQECIEQINWPTRADSKLKGMSCYSDTELIYKYGPNPYIPSNLIKEEKPIIQTYISKEIHTQTVVATNDKFLF
jgi:hypothetical protein